MSNEDEKSAKETNLLIHDRSTKVGTIYFIGLSSKFYAGRLILKKNIITDRIVRQTNLNENLTLIESGSFNIKQTAILIKGVTIFLHRQIEVLLSDLHLLYRKFFLNTERDFKQIVKRIRKDKNRNAMKKKILTLQDINTNTNNNFMDPPNFLIENKNTADVTDLTLQGTRNLFNANYKFDNLEMFQAFNESNMQHNLFDDISSFNNSKTDNIFTLNNPLGGNLFAKDLMKEIKSNNVEEIYSSLKMIDSSSLDTSIKELNPFASLQKQENKNSFSHFFHISFFPDKPKEQKNISVGPTTSWGEEVGKINNPFEKGHMMNGNLNFSFSQHMSERANIAANKMPHINNKKMKRANDKKKGIVEIDQKITLTKHAWDEAKPILKQPKKLTNFEDKLLSEDNNLFHLVKKNNDDNNSNNSNKKKDSEFSPFYSFYEITKNYDHLDTRKELFNMMEKYIETENKINTDKSCHNGMKRKLYYNMLNTDSSMHSTNQLYFEQLRENFTEKNFLNLDELQKNKKQKIGDEFLFSVFSSEDQQEPSFQFDFDNSINDSQYERRDQMKISEDEAENDVKYKNLNSYSETNNLISKDNSKNSTLVDSLKDSLSIPSSKLMNKRSSTASSSIYKNDSNLLRLKTYIDIFLSTKKQPLEFEIICPLKKVNYRNAASTFYSLLVLASNDEIELHQGGPNEKIIIKSF